MAESSKKKRTATKTSTTKKIVEAARTLLSRTAAIRKKSTTKKTPVTKKNELKTRTTTQEKLKKQETEQQYFSGPVIQKFIEERGYELPLGYNESRITLMVRDPYWIHAYWELPGWKIDELKSLMGLEKFNSSKKIIRVYDVTNVDFNGSNANGFNDLLVSDDTRSWYINTGSPDRSYCVDIGFLSPDGKFYLAARSNVVSTPRDSMSDVIDEQWLTIDWERMYALSGGFGIGRSSGEIKEMLKKRLREEMSSGMFSSSSRDIHKKEKGKDFWLVVNTELILYGATEPDAKVTIQGFPIKLRPDGSFTMRFALPDGKLEMPVVAVNSDGDMRKQITPEVEKKTK